MDPQLGSIYRCKSSSTATVSGIIKSHTEKINSADKIGELMIFLYILSIRCSNVLFIISQGY